MKKKKKIMLLLLLILCLIGFGVYTVYCPPHTTDNQVSSSGRKGESKQMDDNGEAINGAVQSKTPKEVLDDLKKSQVNVTDKLSSHILFPCGKAKTQGSWTVENSKTNNVIMQCEVYLDNKLIAKSVPIKPEQHIDEITLNQDVKPGTYDVIAYINYFKTDTNAYISKAGFKVKLTVQ